MIEREIFEIWVAWISWPHWRDIRAWVGVRIVTWGCLKNSNDKYESLRLSFITLEHMTKSWSILEIPVKADLLVFAEHIRRTVAVHNQLNDLSEYRTFSMKIFFTRILLTEVSGSNPGIFKIPFKLWNDFLAVSVSNKTLIKESWFYEFFFSFVPEHDHFRLPIETVGWPYCEELHDVLLNFQKKNSVKGPSGFWRPVRFSH